MSARVSVVMPVYNCERFVAAAVQSVRDQTFTDWQMLAVDDGSTDRSLDILTNLAQIDHRVRIIRIEHAGLVPALNTGLRAATGEFVARMDADDRCMPQRFEQQVAYLEAHPDCVLVGSAVDQIDDDDDPLYPMREITFGHEAIDRALLVRGWPICHPAVMMRRAALDRIGEYRDFAPCEDHDLFVRLAEVGTLENLREPLLQYRRNPNGVTTMGADLHKAKMDELLADAAKRRGLDPQSVYALRGDRVDRSFSRSVADAQTGWRALSAGHPKTARKFALQSLRRQPFSLSTWKLLFCAIRGW